MLVTLEGLSANLVLQYGEDLSSSVDLFSTPGHDVYIQALVRDNSIHSEGSFYFMHLLQRDNSM